MILSILEANLGCMTAGWWIIQGTKSSAVHWSFGLIFRILFLAQCKAPIEYNLSELLPFLL
jgi:hypothetical protein